MYLKSNSPDFFELYNLLQGHNISRCHLLQIHARIICLGAHQHSHIATRLIGRYSLPIALRVFKQLRAPRIFPFNAIIRILSEEKSQSSLTVSFFKRLKQQPLFPNDFTFSFLLKACIHSGNADYVSQFHTQIMKAGFLGNSAVCNGLVAAYAKGLKDFISAHKVFDEMPEKNMVFSWTCLIDVYAKSGLSEKALQLFFLMVKGNMTPENETMVSVLSACSKLDIGELENWIEKLTDTVKDYGPVSSTGDSINMVLTYLYGKWGNVDKSKEAFDRIGDNGKTSVVAWNAIIGAYVQNGCALEALSLFKVMIDNPYASPNHVTMVSILSACSQVGDIDLGIWVHEYMKSRGRENVLCTNSFLATAMVDMYCKCGDLSRAKKVFQSLLSKDVISYSVMIMGLAVNGEGQEALTLFNEMLDCGLCPNSGTFLSILCACCHSGLLEVGRQIFQDMKIRFSISPQLEHYACYIDLLARVGHIEEALDVAKSMPFKPNNFVWGALLGGCLLHFKGKLTQDMSRKLIEVDPQNSAGYVMLSNSLARDHEWSEVSGLRQLMKEQRVKKHRGCSWICIDGLVHEFLAGPCSHPYVASINGMLGFLLKEMKLPS
ncbi:pentatricopeptide repeat-containing protein At2g29760, chloroplastic-like [Chenopodium quinoa]|uniref:Pentatricopeptide repeat-containing protein n=1 Tax=Chenopodium quinoa TaxID=63459 RepID=A0A803M0R1_CHEQI|nr:pentatricopeptide repeat-containing protein At2g29760, chloroplastic-like [Chenopodium quinoa]XP_021761472.1 pentatricopeptide repeat-containing protein At2g29760, chloroplastic-like [Chenopodium quinoa]XP_021761473.1 pentatricopeptide repeat-containing protein At2g29760, chloroplastic-like [Chenopodium quinoa]XP_021761474.1 pentatricopeptide repeat-containing protein At2g29760, chloroplastic-like [Chenopodium quinoa]XP_021761475.1 pentatricopeptide repeat-containing protein At2g29760, chlor